MKRPIGIIGAMDAEVKGLVQGLSEHNVELVGGIEFHTGSLFERDVVIARCGVGKVFAAMCAEAMIIKYSPALIVNTGVAGALDPTLERLDIAVGDRLCQHDMDTSPLGDPIGLISGINKVYFESDRRAVELLLEAGERLGIRTISMTVASGDKFVADDKTRREISASFGAGVCEMEGAAIAQTAYVNKTPFVVIRAISDGANDDSAMDFPTFLIKAAERSAALTLELVRGY